MSLYWLLFPFVAAHGKAMVKMRSFGLMVPKHWDVTYERKKGLQGFLSKWKQNFTLIWEKTTSWLHVLGMLVAKSIRYFFVWDTEDNGASSHMQQASRIGSQWSYRCMMEEGIHQDIQAKMNWSEVVKETLSSICHI